MGNAESFNKIMGGRKREDNRYILKESAQNIREHLNILKVRGVNMSDLSKTLGVSCTTISLAAGGRAGDKPQERFGNLSSTDFILRKLEEMVGNNEK